MAEPKQTMTNTLPAAAGLKILPPKPPNKSFATTMPNKAPIKTIYHLISLGKIKV